MPPNREYWWSTKQPQVTDLRWQLGFQWHRRGIELVFKSLDCFTKRLFHTATFFFFFFFCCYICICCLKLHQADYKVEEFFLNLDLVGEHSAPMYLPVYYLRRILISRPPRVFRRFKRCSCPCSSNRYFYKDLKYDLINSLWNGSLYHWSHTDKSRCKFSWTYL